MKPMARRTGIGSSRTSWPATWTLPALAVSSVASTRSVVVLPAPLGPKMLRKPPRSRLKEMPFSTSRRPNVLRRPSTSISRGAALSCRSGESDMGHPPLGRGAVRAGGVAYGGVRFRDPRLLLLPAPARPQRDHSAGAEQDRADPHPADEWEDHRAQGDGLGRAVERLLGGPLPAPRRAPRQPVHDPPPGHDVREDPMPVRRAIGFISHNPMLYPDLTAQENLRFYADMYGVEGREARVTELLERLELSHRRHDVVRTFSKGMRQRLAIARAILHRPRVLLLDEPHSGLDPRAVDILDGLLTDIRDEHTFVMVTHNIAKGLEWGTRLMIVENGRIAYEHAAVLDDHEAGTPLEALGDVVRDHHEGVLVADVGQQAIEDVDGARVEAGVRLVQQQHARPVEDGARDGQALAHTLAVGAHDVVAAVAELEALEELRDARLAVVHPVHVGVEAQVLQRREVEVQHGVVRDEPDGAAHGHRVVAHVVAGDPDRAGAGREQRGEHAQHGRLAGAVGAEDAEKAAALEAEGKTL